MQILTDKVATCQKFGNFQQGFSNFGVFLQNINVTQFMLSNGGSNIWKTTFNQRFTYTVYLTLTKYNKLKISIMPEQIWERTF